MARSLPTSDGRIGRTLVWLFGLTLALGLAAPGQAQQTPDDHLKCYRIVDSTNLNAQVDLDTEQFGLERECRVQRAELFCAPAAKTVIEAEVGGEPVELLPIFGSDELTDYLCYRLMCAQPDIDAQVVSDQFGTRKIKFLKSELLCVPAIKGTPPPPCGPSSLGQCAGECPNLDDECTVLATGDCA